MTVYQPELGNPQGTFIGEILWMDNIPFAPPKKQLSKPLLVVFCAGGI